MNTPPSTIYVCVCVCVCVCYTCMCVYVCIIQVCVYVYYTCMCVCVYYTCVCVCMCIIHTCLCAYIHGPLPSLPVKQNINFHSNKFLESNKRHGEEYLKLISFLPIQCLLFQNQNKCMAFKLRYDKAEI